MKKTIAVVMCQSKSVLKSIQYYKDSVKFILIGDINKTKELANEINLPLDKFDLRDESNDRKACELGSSLITSGETDIVMKGIVHTGLFMKSLLKHRVYLISLVSRFELPSYHKPLFLTDPGINIYPSFSQKEQIIRNAITVAQTLGVKCPKVACICPVEVVNRNITSTVDADNLSKVIFDKAVVEGPLSLDIALSKDIGNIKSCNSKVSGDVDILLVPSLDVGNALYKSFTMLGEGKVSNVVTGLKIPVVLTSRADSTQVKIDSIKLALDLSN